MIVLTMPFLVRSIGSSIEQRGPLIPMGSYPIAFRFENSLPLSARSTEKRRVKAFGPSMRYSQSKTLMTERESLAVCKKVSWSSCWTKRSNNPGKNGRASRSYLL